MSVSLPLNLSQLLVSRTSPEENRASGGNGTSWDCLCHRHTTSWMVLDTTVYGMPESLQFDSALKVGPKGGLHQNPAFPDEESNSYTSRKPSQGVGYV